MTRCLSIRLSAGAISVSLIVLTSPCPAQDNSSDDRQALATALIDATLDARSRLVSGKYQAAGTWLVGQNGDEQVEAPCVFKGAFDIVEGLIKYEKEAPLLITTPEGRVGAVSAGYAYLRTHDRTYFFDGTGGLTPRQASSILVADREFVPTEYGRPLDLRTFGLCGWATFEVSPTFQEVTEAIRGWKVLDLTGYPREDNCQLKLEPVQGVNVTLTIAHRRGYVIERWETVARTANSEQMVPYESGDLKWASRSETWVPESLLMERTRLGQTSRLALQFEWDSVNSPLAAVAFEPSSLDVSPTAVIMDQRLGGVSIPVGRLKDRGELPPMNGARGLKEPKAGDQNRPTIVWLNLVAILVVLGVAAIAFLRRRLHTSKDK